MLVGHFAQSAKLSEASVVAYALAPLIANIITCISPHSVFGFAVLYALIAWEYGGGGWEYSHRHKSTGCVRFSLCAVRVHIERKRE